MHFWYSHNPVLCKAHVFCVDNQLIPILASTDIQVTVARIRSDNLAVAKQPQCRKWSYM